MLGIGIGGVRAKFGRLESVMELFEQSSDAWNREWRSSSQVPKFGIGNGGVRAKFGRLELVLEFETSSEAWNREWRGSSQVPTLGIGNGGVRAKLRRLESEMEAFEPMAHPSDIALGPRLPLRLMGMGPAH